MSDLLNWNTFENQQQKVSVAEPTKGKKHNGVEKKPSRLK